MHWGKKTFVTGILFTSLSVFAQQAAPLFSGNQKDVPKGWHLLNYAKDSLHGISLLNTYDFLKGRKSKQVIVAVIDGGVDTMHEDLINVLWRNPKEIPGNGIDDDKNGYLDDIFGWNFLGGKDGRCVTKAPHEISRIYHRLKAKYESNFNEDALSDEEKVEYEVWKKARKKLQVDPQSQVELMFLEMATKAAKKHDKILRNELGKEEYTTEDVEKIQTKIQQVQQAKIGFLTFVKIIEMDADETNKSILTQLEEYISDKKRSFDAKESPLQNERQEIVRDNYYDINDRFYGNNDVMGPDAKHGTHVSGIIAAQRNNNVGMDGVADNVKIMTIRAVPDGDEYDKDIALAIKYAVDNGAKVINMSFGKGFSPEKKWVDEAVKYAETKDVLLVRAAGNESDDNDQVESYPSPDLIGCNTKVSNFISVGASSDPKIKGLYIADFSNYGKTTVDVFAPGVKIYSTVTGGNTYGNLQGTSMASPVVAGVAGLIRSYFPTLTATQVKYVIENSVDSGDTIWVNKPGAKNQKVTMRDLCTSGGWVNAYNAVRLAATLVTPERPVIEKKEQAGEIIKAERLPKSSFKNIKVKR